MKVTANKRQKEVHMIFQVESYISHIPQVCLMFSLSYSPSFDHPNNVW
jgi:hypothetical protein